MTKTERDALRATYSGGLDTTMRLLDALDEADEVISALKDDLEETLPYASEYFREKWGLGESLIAADCYIAKCGAK